MPWHFTANVQYSCCVPLWAVTCTVSECLKLFKYSFWMLAGVKNQSTVISVALRKHPELASVNLPICCKCLSSIFRANDWIHIHKHKTPSAAFYELASGVWYHHVFLRHQLLFYEKYASFPWRSDSERFVLETFKSFWYDKVI